ncbi:hypothetical protein ACFWVT_05585 [Streptomyces cyaneofuscatus]|uniref:hypothetical protein n=1 Tax=Streptomyces cyaneofuscatus TaxID=66883 RepID=UPI003651A88A
MPDPTQLTQPDEALRRATSGDQVPAAPTVLLTIADRLTSTRPASPILPPRRAALALRYATDAAGYDTPASHTLERSLLRLMPEITRPITRGEYALLLRAAAGRLTELHSAAAADYGSGPRPGAARNALASARTAGNAAAPTR